MRHASVCRVGKIDRTIALHDHVVGTVQLLALVVAGEHRDGAIGLRACEMARGVLARDQPALEIPSEAIGLVAGLAEGRDSGLGAPAAQVVARHVAEQEVLVTAVPKRALRENTAGRQLLELDRWEFGAETLPRERIVLVQLLEDVASDADFEARSQNRRVTIRYTEPCFVSGIPTLLRSAVENIVRNAIRNTDDGLGGQVNDRDDLVFTEDAF